MKIGCVFRCLLNKIIKQLYFQSTQKQETNITIIEKGQFRHCRKTGRRSAPMRSRLAGLHYIECNFATKPQEPTCKLTKAQQLVVEEDSFRGFQSSRKLLKKCLTDSIYEPRHDKTKKLSVHPAKTQISLGICPV